MLQECFFFNFKIIEVEIKKKHGCQKVVAMETPSHVDSDMSCQIAAR